MRYLIGTDEAGYGPNLGPLVVSASVWRVPDAVRSHELASLLSRAVASSPQEAADGRLAIGDSKALYQSGKGLKHLERGLWAALAQLGRRPRRWAEVWPSLVPDVAAEWRSEFWQLDHDADLPRDADWDDVQRCSAAFQDALADAGVELVDLRSRVVFPRQWNQLLVEHESKGAALSHLTLGLASELMAPLEQGSIDVVCDKHGGRNRYDGLLAAWFPEVFIEIHGEGRAQSVYRFGPPQRRIEFRFQMKAEEHLPVALASMASKYLRELAMQAWNEFWQRRVPGLAATAGYPQDALRFKQAIAAAQAELGIDDAAVWRNK